jgi:hypothetical protein
MRFSSDGHILDARRGIGIQLPLSYAKKVFDGRKVLLFDIRVLPELHPDEGVKVRSVRLTTKR